MLQAVAAASRARSDTAQTASFARGGAAAHTPNLAMTAPAYQRPQQQTAPPASPPAEGWPVAGSQWLVGGGDRRVIQRQVPAGFGLGSTPLVERPPASWNSSTLAPAASHKSGRHDLGSSQAVDYLPPTLVHRSQWRNTNREDDYGWATSPTKPGPMQAHVQQTSAAPAHQVLASSSHSHAERPVLSTLPTRWPPAVEPTAAMIDPHVGDQWPSSVGGGKGQGGPGAVRVEFYERPSPPNTTAIHHTAAALHSAGSVRHWLGSDQEPEASPHAPMPTRRAHSVRRDADTSTGAAAARALDRKLDDVLSAVTVANGRWARSATRPQRRRLTIVRRPRSHSAPLQPQPQQQLPVQQPRSLTPPATAAVSSSDGAATTPISTTSDAMDQAMHFLVGENQRLDAALASCHSHYERLVGELQGTCATSTASVAQLTEAVGQLAALCARPHRSSSPSPEEVAHPSTASHHCDGPSDAANVAQLQSHHQQQVQCLLQWAEGRCAVVGECAAGHIGLLLGLVDGVRAATARGHRRAMQAVAESIDAEREDARHGLEALHRERERELEARAQEDLAGLQRDLVAAVEAKKAAEHARMTAEAARDAARGEAEAERRRREEDLAAAREDLDRTTRRLRAEFSSRTGRLLAEHGRDVAKLQSAAADTMLRDAALLRGTPLHALTPVGRRPAVEDPSPVPASPQVRLPTETSSHAGVRGASFSLGELAERSPGDWLTQMASAQQHASLAETPRPAPLASPARGGLGAFLARPNSPPHRPNSIAAFLSPLPSVARHSSALPLHHNDGGAGGGVSVSVSRSTSRAATSRSPARASVEDTTRSPSLCDPAADIAPSALREAAHVSTVLFGQLPQQKQHRPLDEDGATPHTSIYFADSPSPAGRRSLRAFLER